MNNKIIILWSFLVIIMCSGVFIIGKNYEKNEEYIKASKEIKEYSKKYINDNNMKIKFMNTIIIFSDELYNNYNIKKLIINEKECSYEVKVKEYVLFKNYDIEYNCKEKEKSA